jgi:hypothetical protein
MMQVTHRGRIDEYDREMAQRRLLVFLAKLGIKSAQKQLPFSEWHHSQGHAVS